MNRYSRLEGLIDAVRQVREDLEGLRNRVVNLENGRGAANDEWLTPKSMAVAAGCTRDHEKIEALKFLARSYSKANNLEVRKGEGTKAHEYFHPDAARYAIAQVKGD